MDARLTRSQILKLSLIHGIVPRQSRATLACFVSLPCNDLFFGISISMEMGKVKEEEPRMMVVSVS